MRSPTARMLTMSSAASSPCFFLRAIASLAELRSARELLGLVQHGEAAVLDRVEAAEVHGHALERETGLDLVAVLAEEFQIEHVRKCGSRSRGWIARL